VTVTVVNAELFGEIVAGERNRPRGGVNTDFLRRFMEGFDELLVFRIGKIGRSA
jgi:hypothetical protein